MLGAIFDETNQMVEKFKLQLSSSSPAMVAFDEETFALFVQIVIRLSLGNVTGEAKTYCTFAATSFTLISP